MSTYAEQAWRRFRTKGVLVDTNLLLLFLIGGFDIQIIANGLFKRTAQYDVEDYYLLHRFLNAFSRLVTSAHVLTEVSNLAGQLASPQKEACLGQFGAILTRFEEVPIPSFDAVRQQHFPYVGLTDSVLMTVASEYLIMTDDVRFAHRVAQQGQDVVNLNYFRQENWLK